MTDQGDAVQPDIGSAREEVRKPSISPAAISVFAGGIGSAAIVAALIFAKRSTAGVRRVAMTDWALPDPFRPRTVVSFPNGTYRREYA